MAVHKAGDKEDPYNYRPIAVLPTIARVFEKLIYRELDNYFTKKNLLHNEQFRFRSLHSTALALFQTCYMLCTYMMFYMSVPPPFVFVLPKGP